LPFGIGTETMEEGSMWTVWFDSCLMSAPISSNIWFKVSTSDISGKPSIVTVESAIIAAGTKATALFLEPLIRTDPLNECQTSIMIFYMYFSIFFRNIHLYFLLSIFHFIYASLT